MRYLNPLKRNFTKVFLIALVSTCLFLAVSSQAAEVTADWRNIRTGLVIPDEGYCDMPYIVKTDDGAWLCVIVVSVRPLWRSIICYVMPS